jgi:hypothetical protein
MFESLANPLLQNPIFIAALLAVIRNLGGYAYNCFEAKQLLPYSASQFLVTLGLWETIFVIALGSGSLDVSETTVVTLALDWIRGLKTAIDNNTAPAASVTTYSKPTQVLTTAVSGFGPAGTAIWIRNVYVNGVFDHQDEQVAPFSP